MANFKINDLEAGDIFSESSHYIFKESKNGKNIFTHLESGKDVGLDDKYVLDLLTTADQYEKEVFVTKEDKKDGTLGIRSIFESINASDVFTVCFKKQDEDLSSKALNELKEKQITEALEKLEKAQKSKKGVLNEAKQILKEIQDNHILPYKPGESRVLRGYKLQFVSRDGKYACFDMDMPDGAGKANQRPVNINTLEWLVYKGTKYIVK